MSTDFNAANNADVQWGTRGPPAGSPRRTPSANAAARALYERRGFEAIDEGSLAAACAAAVAREIEGSDEAQILMRLPGTGKKPKPAKAPKKRKAAAEGDDAADAAAAPKKAKKKAAPKKAPPPEESSDDSAPEDVE